MKWYMVTLSHDEGEFSIKVNASDSLIARLKVKAAESCPDSAIVKVKRCAVPNFQQERG